MQIFCYFFSNDERFEAELGYSFNKGLMIIGSTGLGKTKTIEAISHNPIFPISIFSMIDIAEKVRDNGHVELNTANSILLDDVGSEQESVKHYGTSINWFKDFIEMYYLNHRNYRKLIVTTNCGGDEIERKYGTRVRSRVREMFNQIKIVGNDKR
jgi:DNA replication protein DnaC